MDRNQIGQTQEIGAKIMRKAQTYIEDFAFLDPAEVDLVEDFRRRFGA